jgi:predicted nucleotidyltransferase
LAGQTAQARCYTAAVIGRLRSILESDPRVAYALLFGSRARERAHDRSDTDVAIGLVPGARLATTELEDLLEFCSIIARGISGR